MQPKKQDSHRNPLVYLDIAIDKEIAGRVICELRKDVVPKTAENFRALCTGERGIGSNGKPLWYKGCKFHKAIAQFMVQSGDIISNDGSGGESIYGPCFPDENFILEHEEGVLSMANMGRPHTNGSQFCITTVPCPHLDGTNVVFGKVRAGRGLLLEIQQLSAGAGPHCRPRLECVIIDCGELQEINERNACCVDGTPDRLPAYPEDYVRADATPAQLLPLLNAVKQCGNEYFEAGRWAGATRKYLKCLRYLAAAAKFASASASASASATRDWDQYLNVTKTYQLQCNLNLAACFLKTEEYESCIHFCDEVMSLDGRNDKALYRRGQANFALANYEAALADLRRADDASPNNKAVQKLLEEVRQSNQLYISTQKQRLSKFFREHREETPAKSAGY